jgi:hypothetical protein
VARAQNTPAVLAPAAVVLAAYVASISQLQRAVDSASQLAVVAFAGQPSKLEVEAPARSPRLHDEQSPARARIRPTSSPTRPTGGRPVPASSPPLCSTRRPASPDASSRPGRRTAATQVKAAALSAGTSPTSHGVRSKRTPTPVAASHRWPNPGRRVVHPDEGMVCIGRGRVGRVPPSARWWSSPGCTGAESDAVNARVRLLKPASQLRR